MFAEKSSNQRDNLRLLQGALIKRSITAQRGVPFEPWPVQPRLNLGRFTMSLLCVAALAAALPITLRAQAFQTIPSLSFTKAYQGDNPLPQAITIASGGSCFNFYASAVSTTGGNWLTINVSGNCCESTPYVIIATANPAVDLAPGTYTGQITATSQNGGVNMTIPVSLVIKPSTATFFDALPGGLSFSMKTQGNAPPAQPVQIRNAGAGTLNWTASATTADGGAWLGLSSKTGTAPSILNVSIVPGNLPNSGLQPGTFTGQVVMQTAGDRVTIPITVTVGASVFNQLDPLNFTKQYQSSVNPLPQSITVASTGANFDFFSNAVSSTGGDWLAINVSGNCCETTSYVITASVNPAIHIAAGNYSAEIII